MSSVPGMPSDQSCEHRTGTTTKPRSYRPEPAALPDCPHCGNPVTIVALLTTPQIA